MPVTEPFEEHPERYDAWFEEHPHAFAAERNALRALVPEGGRGLEIGVGTGRFAAALGMEEGVDPAPAMRRRARARGLRVKDGTAEELPYDDATFDVALLVTTVCFVDDLDRALAEAYRVLRPAGALVIGLVDRDSPLGQRYLKQQDANPFYQPARFWTTDEIVRAMRQAGFDGFAFRQTLEGELNGLDAPPPVTDGYDAGAFVVIRGRKPGPEAQPATPGADTARRTIRHNPITGRDVIVAPARGGRPKQTDPPSNAPPAAHHPDCPFCPGHEDALPYIIDEQPAPDDAPWQTRAVPNKYPALVPSPPAPGRSDALFRRAAAKGHQEVIIESPMHGYDLTDLSEDALEIVVATYQARCRALRAGDEALTPFLFRNFGAEAGASLEHPHSQLIATRQLPPTVAAEEQRARAYHADTGRCLYCDVVQRAAAGPRTVAGADGFLAFVPFAAEVPCEMMLLPTDHRVHFTAMADGPRRAFARLLHRALKALRRACGHPAYNFYLRTPSRADAEAPHQHWYLRVLPRTKVQAGFEVSTGLRINPSSPEDDALHLRRALD